MKWKICFKDDSKKIIEADQYRGDVRGFMWFTAKGNLTALIQKDIVKYAEVIAFNNPKFTSIVDMMKNVN